jgi:crossover junction endodeoxyribonuclease RusA
MVESSRYVKDWRAWVRAAAARACPDPIAGPVEVALGFRMPRPASHFGTGRNWLLMKPSAPAHHTQRPDVDKLTRAVLDALTGIAYGDDSTVVAVHARKRWERHPNLPGGVTIIIRGVEP